DIEMDERFQLPLASAETISLMVPPEGTPALYVKPLPKKSSVSPGPSWRWKFVGVWTAGTTGSPRSAASKFGVKSICSVVVNFAMHALHPSCAKGAALRLSRLHACANHELIKLQGPYRAQPPEDFVLSMPLFLLIFFSLG